MTASEILEKYLSFFEHNGHKRTANAPLVPQNDPTTLFTSSGMQPLVPYLLGESHPLGTRLVNVQNCLRAQDIDEIGDNRHTTFFRMLGNWSLGDYFKKEQLPWFFTFLTKELGIDPSRLYVTVFEGNDIVPKDTESIAIWKALFASAGIEAEEGKRIHTYGVDKNWWSRAGEPGKMPAGEPGGPDSEVFYDFQDASIHQNSPYKDETCHVNCDCGRYIEIGNSVFMQYLKQEDGSFDNLPKQNVDFGGGLERILAAAEHKQDVFQTTLLHPIIKSLEKVTGKPYTDDYAKSMRIITDHMISATFITANNVYPSNKDQGYILRRFIRRAYDHFAQLEGKDITPVIEAIVEQYKVTDPVLVEKFEHIKYTVLEEIKKYSTALQKARSYIDKKYGGKEVSRGIREITPDDVFYLYSSHGLSPTQVKSLGYTFDEQKFAEKMEEHQKLSRKGAEQKFRGGLADHQERTIMGHTATHLLHQALRDMLGKQVHQSGSNITTERVRFDFNYDQKLTDEQIKELEDTVNQKIKDNVQVHFDMIQTQEAKEMGAIGLFEDTYQNVSKIYFIGPDIDAKHIPDSDNGQAPEGTGDQKAHLHEKAYSIEFCGGPHVDFTGKIKSFKIIKQESLGKGFRRLYAVVG